jgi:hypothetical protein
MSEKLVKVALWGLYCQRCGYRWVPRGLDQQKDKPSVAVARPPDNPGKMPKEIPEAPKTCPNPKCKSPYWDRPRQSEG